MRVCARDVDQLGADGDVSGLRRAAGRRFTSEVWAGWVKRLVVAAYLLWQLIVARLLVANKTAHCPG